MRLRKIPRLRDLKFLAAIFLIVVIILQVIDLISLITTRGSVSLKQEKPLSADEDRLSLNKKRLQSADQQVLEQPQFVYLAQAHSVHDVPGLKAGKNREIIWLTYKDKSGDIYFPNSTLTAGRNCLLREAVARASKREDGGYLYYIFIDDDVQIQSDSNTALWWRKDLPENPFDRFELFLLDFQPAVAVARERKTRADMKDAASLLYNFDACFNGFHRHMLSFMLPYVEDLDHISWWFQQWYVIHISAMLYNSYRMQVNSVIYHNTRFHRRSKTKGDFRESGDFDIPRKDVLSWVAKDTIIDTRYSGKNSLLRTFEKPALYYDIKGNATKKGDMEYRVSTEFIKKAFNASHPSIQRILRWRAQPTVKRILYGNDKVEPDFTPDIFSRVKRILYGNDKVEPRFIPDIFPE